MIADTTLAYLAGMIDRAARTGNLEDAAHARRYQAMGEALSEITRQLNRAPRQIEPGSQADWEAKHG